jgi:NAD(P)-dependent dehydrogenase (short-subunit alcohol dehydrogenase family)
MKMKDYFGYQGKVCVLTGAASGMAKAATEFLVELGAEVYALDISECAVPGIKKFIKTDLGDKASIDAAFAKIPETIHKFFGIAGISGLKHDYNTTFTVDFIANWYITETYLKKRIAEGPVGAIVYVSSIGGAKWAEYVDEYKGIVESKSFEEMQAKLVALGGTVSHKAYVLAKRALNYYVKKKVGEFGARNVRINAVGPGITKTGLFGDFLEMSGGKEENMRVMWGGIKRHGESKDMGDACVVLNSDLSQFVSGHVLIVDGGGRAQIEVGDNPIDIMDGKML